MSYYSRDRDREKDYREDREKDSRYSSTRSSSSSGDPRSYDSSKRYESSSGGSRYPDRVDRYTDRYHDEDSRSERKRDNFYPQAYGVPPPPPTIAPSRADYISSARNDSLSSHPPHSSHSSSDSYPRSFGGYNNNNNNNNNNNDSGGYGENLPKQNWDLAVLPKFEKNFYYEHADIRNLSEEEVSKFRQSKDIRVMGSNCPRPIRNFEESSFPGLYFFYRILFYKLLIQKFRRNRSSRNI